MKSIFIHSFHSQVPITVSNLDEWFDSIVCMDSHIDDYLPPRELVEAYPERVRLVASRAAAHTELRMCTGGIPALREEDELILEMLLIVPQRSMLSSIGQYNDILELAAKSSGQPVDALKMSPASYERLLKKVHGMELFCSPPKNLLTLVEKGRNSEVLLDVDVDYMSDMQTECYSPLKNVHPGELNWSERVVRYIRKSKPTIITLSEVKIAALRNPQSTFSRFLNNLISLGYHVEKEVVLESDDEAKRLLDLFEECYNKVVRQFQVQRTSSSLTKNSENSSSEMSDEIKAIQDFFRGKGVTK